eukprot:scaffold409_cov323-Prasinococcus_capsulatus_cf.AAC.3
MGAPKNAVSYMHRAGRAGRMRARQLHQEQDTKPFPPGVVTVFIAPGEEAHLLQMARCAIDIGGARRAPPPCPCSALSSILGLIIIILLGRRAGSWAWRWRRCPSRARARTSGSTRRSGSSAAWRTPSTCTTTTTRRRARTARRPSLQRARPCADATAQDDAAAAAT